MVHGSELPFRMLLRSHGFSLCYSPMIDCRQFLDSPEHLRRIHFETMPGDSPLIAQFCTDNAADFVQAAKIISPQVVAVDLNLGCPKQRALRENFGVALMQDWRRVREILSKAVEELSVPVTCKIRIYEDDIAKSVEYARLLESIGIALLAVHGRGPKSDRTGRVDLETIAAICQAVRIPVVANGGVSSKEDVNALLKQTGCASVMVASALLINPFFLETPLPQTTREVNSLGIRAAAAYLEKCKECGFQLEDAEDEVARFRLACVRDHLRSFFRPVFSNPSNGASSMRMMKGLLLNNKLCSFDQIHLFTELMEAVLEEGMDSEKRKKMKLIRDHSVYR